VSIVVGFIGAYGLWLAKQMGLPDFFTENVQGKPFTVLWAIIGPAIFTFIVALQRRVLHEGLKSYFSSFSNPNTTELIQ
jgi:uncharacterized membrane protein YeaQ/YmgE (transglycosylase-associated protein family)